MRLEREMRLWIMQYVCARTVFLQSRRAVGGSGKKGRQAVLFLSVVCVVDGLVCVDFVWCTGGGCPRALTVVAAAAAAKGSNAVPSSGAFW